jgi:hypothetical protein
VSSHPGSEVQTSKDQARADQLSFCRTWGPVGLKSWEIFELTESSGYQIQAVLRWDSLESWEKAPKDKVLGDIPNFTAAQPLMLTGNSKASVVI